MTRPVVRSYFAESYTVSAKWEFLDEPGPAPRLEEQARRPRQFTRVCTDPECYCPGEEHP